MTSESAGEKVSIQTVERVESKPVVDVRDNDEEDSAGAPAKELTTDPATLFDSEPSEQEQREVLRKLDMLLMPLLCGCVLCASCGGSVLTPVQMLDKSLLNYANLMNIRTDTNLSIKEYSWLGTILYLGYFAATPFHAYGMQHIQLSRYVTMMVVLWGIDLACHAACHSFSTLMVCRFFLGFLEAAINPAFVLLTGRFYKREEQVVRVGIWFSMNGFAMIVGGLMAFGILRHPPSGMLMWQEMFIAVGVATVAFGVLCLCVWRADDADRAASSCRTRPTRRATSRSGSASLLCTGSRRTSRVFTTRTSSSTS